MWYASPFSPTCRQSGFAAPEAVAAAMAASRSAGSSGTRSVLRYRPIDSTAYGRP